MTMQNGIQLVQQADGRSAMVYDPALGKCTSLYLDPLMGREGRELIDHAVNHFIRQRNKILDAWSSGQFFVKRYLLGKYADRITALVERAGNESQLAQMQYLPDDWTWSAEYTFHNAFNWNAYIMRAQLLLVDETPYTQDEYIAVWRMFDAARDYI